LGALLALRRGEPACQTVGRCLQGFSERRRPSRFNILGEVTGHENNRVAIFPHGSLRADAEPLRPGDLNKRSGKTAAGHLLVALDR
jgi:hypothetical protein